MITFPSLGISLNPSRVAFTVFGKDIYWYGIIIAAGFCWRCSTACAGQGSLTCGRTTSWTCCS